MSVDEQTLPAEPGLAEPADGLAHLTCCLDDDAALCGGLLRGAWIPEGADPGPAACVVCEEIWRSPYCPVFGRCGAVT